MQWFLSDIHFGHFNVIEYDDRPFSSLREMEDTIVENIHASIARNDEVYFLGDFVFRSKPQEVDRILERVTAKGKWFFVRGNHDHKKSVREIKKYATDGAVHDILQISPSGQPIILCHYPLMEWNKSYYGSWHLHGHDHKNLRYGDGKLRYNVAINLNNYYPVSLQKLQRIFSGS